MIITPVMAEGCEWKKGCDLSPLKERETEREKQ